MKKILTNTTIDDDTYSVGDWVSTTEGEYTYIIVDIPEAGMFNDYIKYSGPHNKSFYKSEIRFATPEEIRKNKVFEEFRGGILAEVYKQITKDVYVEDFTAIEQLLKTVSTNDLVEYLPEKEYR